MSKVFFVIWKQHVLPGRAMEGGGRGRGSWASPNGSATKARRSPPHPLTQMARAITTPQVQPAQSGPGPGPPGTVGGGGQDHDATDAIDLPHPARKHPPPSTPSPREDKVAWETQGRGFCGTGKVRSENVDQMTIHQSEHKLFLYFLARYSLLKVL